MRNLTKVLMTAALAAAFVSLTLAQQGRGFGGMQMNITEAQLLAAAPIQSELKLTDAQKEKVTKLTEKINAERKDLLGGGKGKGFDKEKFAKFQEDTAKETAEFVKTELKPEQAKRLKQLTLQAALQFSGPQVFKRDEVQTDLKFTDKQKELTKTVAEDTQKDARELLQGAGFKDKEKREAAQEKITKLNQEAVDKITGTFSADQKTAWKNMLGEKFEMTRAMFPMGGGRNKKKDN